MDVSHCLPTLNKASEPSCRVPFLLLGPAAKLQMCPGFVWGKNCWFESVSWWIRLIMGLQPPLFIEWLTEGAMVVNYDITWYIKQVLVMLVKQKTTHRSCTGTGAKNANSKVYRCFWASRSLRWGRSCIGTKSHVVILHTTCPWLSGCWPAVPPSTRGIVSMGSESRSGALQTITSYLLSICKQ